MATIHVKEKFTFTGADGTGTPYAVGTHTGVPADVAKHPFVKAHCTDLPLNDEKDNGAALLALQTVIGERDAQIGDLASQLAAVTAELNASHIHEVKLAGECTALTTERDTLADTLVQTQQQAAALTTERDTLANQVAELQAGGTPAKKKN